MHGDRSVLYDIHCFSRQQRDELCFGCFHNKELRSINLGSDVCEKEVDDSHRRVEFLPLTTLSKNY